MNLVPIGYLRNGPADKDLREAATGILEILPEYAPALEDLDGFTRIWVLFHFDRNSGWRPKVLPPHGRTGRKGLFATRSPHRPNPLGMTAVQLLKIQGNQVHIGPHDLTEGTPILDLKPYLPRFDAFPDESHGWFAEVPWEPEYTIEGTWPNEALQKRAEAILKIDPLPHRTRRIVPYDDGFRLSVGRWRVHYHLEGKRVILDQIYAHQPL